MKNRYVKILLVIVVLFSLCFLSFKHMEEIKADSGWDSSYDSGGSFDSGGSWDSGSDWGGSSWDNDYDYDDDYSSNGGSSSSDFGIFESIIIFMFFSFMVLAIYTALKNATKTTKKIVKNLNNNQYNNLKKYEKLTVDEANKIIPDFDIEEFNFKAYQIFYDTQIAWMDFDYNKLKELLTDELYNSYVMQLDALKVKNQKNTMKDFELYSSYIFDLKEVNDKYIAKVYLNVSFYDYIENSNSGIVLRGTTSRKLNNTYILTFIRTKEKTDNIHNCPMCGAPVEGNVTGICEYCKSKLINETHDWVMSKKEKINQR